MSACTPCFSSTRRVSSGYSVDTLAPAGRSARRRTGESPATASTTRMGLAVSLEYDSSPSDRTSAPVSSIQSRPVMPRSNFPSAT